jgi:hypothetical protein
MLEMLKEVAPGIVRAAVIFGTNPQYLVYLHSFGTVAPTLAVELSAAAFATRVKSRRRCPNWDAGRALVWLFLQMHSQ